MKKDYKFIELTSGCGKVLIPSHEIYNMSKWSSYDNKIKGTIIGITPYSSIHCNSPSQYLRDNQIMVDESIEEIQNLINSDKDNNNNILLKYSLFSLLTFIIFFVFYRNIK